MIVPSAPTASLALGVAAALAYALPTVGAQRLPERTAHIALWCAWLLHGGVIGLGLAQTPLRFGFAPALSMTVWLALTVYAVERQVFPTLRARWTLAGLGAAAVLVALAFPGTPLPAQASAMMPVHWALGIASYGLFAAAVIHAWLLRRAEQAMRAVEGAGPGLPLLTLERLTFRFAAAGFALLSATLAAGLLFGDSLHGTGRSARWDHKAVFSVLAWLAFAVLFLGRWRFGWRGRRAVRILYLGSLFLLLAYAGSRFVLEVMLGRSL